MLSQSLVRTRLSSAVCCVDTSLIARPDAWRMLSTFSYSSMTASPVATTPRSSSFMLASCGELIHRWRSNMTRVVSINRS